MTTDSAQQEEGAVEPPVTPAEGKPDASDQAVPAVETQTGDTADDVDGTATAEAEEEPEEVVIPDAPASMPGLLGRKIGMTTMYDDNGRARAVTLIECGPCVVTQVKTRQRDGYQAIQVGFMLASKVNSPMAGHFDRAGKTFKHLYEFKVGDLGEFEVGQEVRANIFEAGEGVKVTGRSKGKGFQGGVKRYGFAGGPKTHGQSDRHRAPGSVGAGTYPGRVWRGTRMAGLMGDKRITTRGLSIASVDPANNYVFVYGAVPGARNSIVRIEKQTT